MNTTISEALERAITDVVAPAAADVDANGTFPRAGIDALGEAGALGLISATEVGGAGEGMDAACQVVERLAATCGSTAMVVLMHYAAVPVIEAFGSHEVREAIGAGRHLSTLALSETGSRSHFWAPLSTAVRTDDGVALDAQKSWVTSAAHADSYVWSSRPLSGDGPMTLWHVPSTAAGLSVAGGFDGLGLRGNGSVPMTAAGVVVAAEAMLGGDGQGLDVALMMTLPWFLVMSASFSLGAMEAVTAEATAHLTTTRLAHLDQSLAQQPVTRLELARMRVETDRSRAFLTDTLAALGTGRADAQLRVLEVKAVAGEAAIDVTERAMKVCGGAAFRKELGIERHFRNARAARVMAPTTDALLDFVGRVICGLPLLDRPGQ